MWLNYTPCRFSVSVTYDGTSLVSSFIPDPATTEGTFTAPPLACVKHIYSVITVRSQQILRLIISLAPKARFLIRLWYMLLQAVFTHRSDIVCPDVYICHAIAFRFLWWAIIRCGLCAVLARYIQKLFVQHLAELSPLCVWPVDTFSSIKYVGEGELVECVFDGMVVNAGLLVLRVHAPQVMPRPDGSGFWATWTIMKCLARYWYILL